MGKPARVILLDIETAPNLGYVWGKWEQDVIDFKKNWYLLSFAWKELGAKRTRTLALPDYPRFSKDKENDKSLTKDLWKVLNEADVVVAHNGDAFDFKKSNARFIAHGLPPPKPYLTIDTLKVARKYFKFDSNKLDDLGKYLGVGRKLPHTGAHLWFGCMHGDKKSWKIMREYNAQDIRLLERVYLKLRPWASNHPNLTFFSRDAACPACQSENFKENGWRYTATGKKQRRKCLDCGHQFTDRKHIRYEASVRHRRVA